MKNFFLTLHMISMCLVVGTLFLQSLIVVFRLRLKSNEQVEGIRNVQTRIHKFIYYPILAVTILSGIVLAVKTNVFGEANWIYAKLILLMALIAFGVMNGKQIKKDLLPKKYAMMVHIPIFIIAAFMIYLATIKPF
ncbi:MAG: CopD family protein [Nitrospinae bacterium]|nr:CopD family protein [Nitrospinota bacterium]